MKKHILLLGLILLLVTALFVGCDKGNTPTDTTVDPDTTVADVTETPTETTVPPTTEAPTEMTTDATVETPAEGATEESAEETTEALPEDDPPEIGTDPLEST